MKQIEEEELLARLKAEIYRLGLQDTPSRTQYSKVYDKTLAPAPTTVMYRTGMTWKQVLTKIGLGDVADNIGHFSNNHKHNSGRPRLIDDDYRDILLDNVCYYVYKEQIKTVIELKKCLREHNLPSYETLNNANITWSMIKKRTQSKYNCVFPKYSEWKSYDDNSLKELVKTFIKEKNIRGIPEYSRKNKGSVPSIQYLNYRFKVNSNNFMDYFSE